MIVSAMQALQTPTCQRTGAPSSVYERLRCSASISFGVGRRSESVKRACRRSPASILGAATDAEMAVAPCRLLSPRQRDDVPVLREFRWQSSDMPHPGMFFVNLSPARLRRASRLGP